MREDAKICQLLSKQEEGTTIQSSTLLRK